MAGGKGKRAAKHAVAAASPAARSSGTPGDSRFVNAKPAGLRSLPLSSPAPAADAKHQGADAGPRDSDQARTDQLQAHALADADAASDDGGGPALPPLLPSPEPAAAAAAQRRSHGARAQPPGQGKAQAASVAAQLTRAGSGVADSPTPGAQPRAGQFTPGSKPAGGRGADAKRRMSHSAVAFGRSLGPASPRGAHGMPSRPPHSGAAAEEADAEEQHHTQQQQQQQQSRGMPKATVEHPPWVGPLGGRPRASMGASRDGLPGAGHVAAAPVRSQKRAATALSASLPATTPPSAPSGRSLSGGGGGGSSTRAGATKAAARVAAAAAAAEPSRLPGAPGASAAAAPAHHDDAEQDAKRVCRLPLERLRQHVAARGDADAEPSTPPLLRREPSGDVGGGGAPTAESSFASVASDAGAVAAAARCIASLPIHRLTLGGGDGGESDGEGASPPRHRRAPPSLEPLTPRGSLVEARDAGAWGGGEQQPEQEQEQAQGRGEEMAGEQSGAGGGREKGALAGARAEHAQQRQPSGQPQRPQQQHQQQGQRQQQPQRATPLKSRAAAAAAHGVPQRAGAAAAGSPLVARALAGGGGVRARGSPVKHSTPVSTPQSIPRQQQPAQPKRTPVPRLDLTPVFQSQELGSASGGSASGGSRGGGDSGPLPLQPLDGPAAGHASGGGRQAAADMGLSDSDVEDFSDARKRWPRDGAAPAAPAAAASAKGSAKSAASKAGGRAASGKQAASGKAAPGSGAAAKEPEEAFYIYAPAVPKEESKSFEDIRRALRARGQHNLVSEVQNLWERYTEARRNCEAMAFRGHRLLDQVSNEFGGYKREAEERLEQLSGEVSEWKEQAEMALAVVPASGMQLAQQEEVINEQATHIAVLEEQLQLMRAQLQRDPSDLTDDDRARLIAGSATTNILLKKVCQQEVQLAQQAKLAQDLKAALLLVCGVLKQTSFVQPDDPVRNALPPQMVQMIDMMLSSAQVEEMLAEQAANYSLLGTAPAPGAPPHPTPGKWITGAAGGALEFEGAGAGGAAGASCVVEERAGSSASCRSSIASGRGFPGLGAAGGGAEAAAPEAAAGPPAAPEALAEFAALALEALGARGGGGGGGGDGGGSDGDSRG